MNRNAILIIVIFAIIGFGVYGMTGMTTTTNTTAWSPLILSTFNNSLPALLLAVLVMVIVGAFALRGNR